MDFGMIVKERTVLAKLWPALCVVPAKLMLEVLLLLHHSCLGPAIMPPGSVVLRFFAGIYQDGFKCDKPD
jgi:hypothetical protein